MRSNFRSAHERTLIIALAAAVALALSLSGAARAQVKKPITRKGLINGVKINGFSTREYVREIERRGVDFEMTPDAESEIRGAGGRPEIIEAARTNYRPPARPAAPTVGPARPAVRPPSNNPGGAPGGVAAPVPSGPPLSKDAIIELLRNGVPADRVERNVEARGVSFSMTPEIAREITAAGGTRSLVGAITEKAASAPAESPGVFASTPADTGPSYDDITDGAQASFLASDFNGAIRNLQQAIRMEPQNPKAYQLLGSFLLYGQGNILNAEQAMRAAIERDGSARFIVAHDHDGGFNQFCIGSFFVSKTGVSFVANDGRDTFETDDTNIKEAKTNAIVGAQYGAFHIKPKVKINNRDNFNFAPYSRQKVESQLILRLIQGY